MTRGLFDRRTIHTYDNGDKVIEETIRRHIDADGVELWCVGWGDKTISIPGPYFTLGTAGGLANKRSRGRYNNPRRLLWDIAFGYVNGFRKRDILWYVLTRTLSFWKKREV